MPDYNTYENQTSELQPTGACGSEHGSDYLGTITSIASRSHTKGLQVVRFAMQAAARELLPHSRVGFCRRRVIPGRETVEVWQSNESKRAYYLNLALCNLIWQCPVCAAKITEERRQVLQTAFSAQELIIGAEGEGFFANKFHIALATYTIAHKKTESAVAVLARLQAAYRHCWSGRWAKAIKVSYRIIGTLGGLELTHGKNGWHPHIHCLLISDSAFNAAVETSLYDGIKKRWQESVSRVGGYASEKAGFDLRVSDDKGQWILPEYLSKQGTQVDDAARSWGAIEEISKYPTKRGKRDGRTLWQLLVDYMGGDVMAGTLWIEGTGALKGAKYMRPSPGLWDVLGVSKDVESDEIMGEERAKASDRLLASLSLDQWRVVIRHDLRGQLLEVASTGDPAYLRDWLLAIGVDLSAQPVEGDSAESQNWEVL